MAIVCADAGELLASAWGVFSIAHIVLENFAAELLRQVRQLSVGCGLSCCSGNGGGGGHEAGGGVVTSVVMDRAALESEEAMAVDVTLVALVARGGSGTSAFVGLLL